MDLSWLTTQEFLLYGSIPVTSAIVGWGTNVLALKMTFHPLEFVGIRPFLGWQGIIPAKAESMARRTVDLITTRLVGVQEVIDRLDAERVTEELEEGVAQMIGEVIDEIMCAEKPQIWEALPAEAREQVYARAASEAPAVIRESLVDLKIEIDEVLDLEEMAVEALLEDRAFLNQIFLECGYKEFRFIERSGLYFGFLFGLVSMGLWIAFPQQWLLPTVGFVIGYLTNFLALKMIFEPTEPREIAGFTWQGSFLQRQDEVSEAYARLITDQIVNTRNIMQAIFEGPHADRLLQIIERHVDEAARGYEAVPRPITNFLIGSEDYEALKTDIASTIVEGVPGGPIYEIEDYADEAFDLERTLRERLRELPPAQFAGLLRPIFQQDEWKLILVGAVLGLLVGLFQALVLLA
jgi:uncharacterized membrane protein YheB (UPF0754 family)